LIIKLIERLIETASSWPAFHW